VGKNDNYPFLVDREYCGHHITRISFVHSPSYRWNDSTNRNQPFATFLRMNRARGVCVPADIVTTHDFILPNSQMSFWNNTALQPCPPSPSPLYGGSRTLWFLAIHPTRKISSKDRIGGYLKQFPKESFSEAYQKWEERWHSLHEGRYFEKE